MGLDEINDEDLVVIHDNMSGIYLLHIENDSNDDPIDVLKHYRMLFHMPSRKHIVFPNNNKLNFEMNQNLYNSGRLS